MSADALAARVAALEAELALPGEQSPSAAGGSSSEAAGLKAELDATKRALGRAQYRVLHLTRAYDALVARLAAAEGTK